MGSLLNHPESTLIKNDYSSNYSSVKEDIFFNWGTSEEHRIRLVGEFRVALSHWIGESQFGEDITLLNPKAFKNGVPLQVACGNWDPELEKPREHNCPICKLGENAAKMLSKYGKDTDEATKAMLKKIINKCKVKGTHLFLCIDRDNPYVNKEEQKKGLKIIKMPDELFKAIISMSSKLTKKDPSTGKDIPIDIASREDGIDIVIKRVKPVGKGKTTYTASPDYDGMTVKQTPLTSEELAYKEIPLLKFCGKEIDVKRWEEELVDDNSIRDIYELSEEQNAGNSQAGTKAPF